MILENQPLWISEPIQWYILNEIIIRIKYYSFEIWYLFHIYQEIDINTILAKYHNLIYQFWYTLLGFHISL